MNSRILIQAKIWMILLGAMLSLSSIKTYAQGNFMDHRGGNGGISIASEFSTIAQNIAIFWEDMCIQSENLTDDSHLQVCDFVEDFNQMLDHRSPSFVTVLTKNEIPGFDGNSRDAINNSLNKIEVSADAWNDMENYKDSIIRKAKLVLHEYTSILGLDSSDYYGFSNKLYSLLSRKNYNMNLLTGVEILSDKCSTKVYTQDSAQLGKKMQTLLSDKSYKVTSATEKSRYKISLMGTCKNELTSNTCGIYFQQVDSFKNMVINSGLIVDNQIFTGDNAIYSDLAEKIQKQIIVCR